MKLHHAAEVVAIATASATLLTSCAEAQPVGPATTVVSHDKACDGKRSAQFDKGVDGTKVLDLVPVSLGILVCKLVAGHTVWVVTREQGDANWVVFNNALATVGDQEEQFGDIGKPVVQQFAVVDADPACTNALYTIANSPDNPALPNGCTIVDQADLMAIPTAY